MTGPVGVRLSATRTRATNDHGQPLGRPVEWTGAIAPAQDAVLEGRGVRLEPVGPQHVDDLVRRALRRGRRAALDVPVLGAPRDRDELARDRRATARRTLAR